MSLPEPVSVGAGTVHIPKCCVEGDPDCPHVKKDSPIRNKKNIGM